jgi:hypothetical protein
MGVAIVSLLAATVVAVEIYRRQKKDAERLRQKDREEKRTENLAQKKRSFVHAVEEGMAAYRPLTGYRAIPDRDVPARAESRQRGMAAVDAAFRDLQELDGQSPGVLAAARVREGFRILFVNAAGENHAERLEAVRQALDALDRPS